MSIPSDQGTPAWRMYGENPTPHSYSALWTAFSYFISLIGTLTTMELLHRQTSSRGLYNWYLLAGASIAMGGVAIWSMHFIGNQSISMGDGSQAMQLIYVYSYTVVSFILPILVVASSFLVFSLSNDTTWWNIMVGGFLAGSAIVGMHYLGEKGIGNYYTTFDAGTVAGACAIAIFAATTSLGLFFRFKSHWSSAAWKRLLCACMLALTTSSMHWVAAIGTTYIPRRDLRSEHGGFPSNTAAWICGILSIVCCLVLLVFMILWQNYLYNARQKACEVTLAICVWDPEERLMLNAAGSLPSTRITRAFFDDMWDEEFQPGHPVFCWMYRVSRNWKACVNLVPRMRSRVVHLKQAGILEAEGRNAQSHTKIFKEQFCVAAADLASRLGQRLEAIGILYDRVITTGASKRPFHQSPPLTSPNIRGVRDVESITFRIAGKGQVLFLVKHATRKECGHLQATGYAFAPVDSIIGGLARHGQIEVDALRFHLRSMAKYKPALQSFQPGVYLCIFCAKPNMYQSFDVLVEKHADNLLPAVRLPSVERLERWQQDILTEFSGRKAKELMHTLPSLITDETRSTQHRLFLAELGICIGYLRDRTGPQLFAESVFTATPFEGPCAKTLDSEGNLLQSMLFAFRLVTNLHAAQPPDASNEYIPFRLFATQQRCYANSPDHATFASLLHREFSGFNSHHSLANLAGRARSVSSQRPRQGYSKLTGTGLRRLSQSEPYSRIQSQAADVSHDENTSSDGSVRQFAPNALGGILVSSQVSVNVSERSRCSSVDEGKGSALMPTTIAVEAAPLEKETDTFADELLVHALRDHVMHQRSRQNRTTARPL